MITIRDKRFLLIIVPNRPEEWDEEAPDLIIDQSFYWYDWMKIRKGRGIRKLLLHNVVEYVPIDAVGGYVPIAENKEKLVELDGEMDLFFLYNARSGEYLGQM